ncbi:efflux RND transporter periplasmic adaptor subunit [Chryseolinea lacunae]|uniref:Efflux RND transporter periplasmic adaptor subunit n=1 Tax=Chryseolinea lacunae TaxID=2801331 RepID=A0ABS1KUM7_9BACT|nr:efflux RND transporter periplasmic adaptor subunit [Chryseolinea lacunae]MBL0743141.1 efflux RND transporter periplasmic adaptor subunit [Chryseolinea lacunae]
MKNASIFIVLVSALAMACGHERKDDASQKLPVTELIVKDTIVQREYVGDINAFRNVEIRARVQGYLDYIYVDEGQEVKKGQPLFRINDEEYRAAYTQAKANLSSIEADAKATELQMRQVKLLVEKEIISKTELDMAQAKLSAIRAKIEEARSALSNAEIRLSHTHIKAPFDGVIDRLPFKMGSLIDEGSLLTTVSDLESFYTYFNVSEKEYLEYIKQKSDNTQANDEVELILADGSLYEQKGQIETMEGEFEASTGNIAFRARFPNPKKLIKHGASGRVRLTSEMENALFVPQKATLEIQDKTYVYVVDDKNQVRMQSFTPKVRFSHFYIVETGLKPGDKVVYEGIQNIRNGMSITPAYLPLDSLILMAEQKPVAVAKI